MNAVEIEEAISGLAEQPFEAAEFPFAFLAAFGNKETTIKRLRSRDGNYSDCGGVLQRNNAHIVVAPDGEVGKALAALKASSATLKHKVQFVIATDGAWFEAEDLESGETVACKYADFPNHFGFFLPLAGISTVRQVRENSIDIRATSRLNRLYIELLKANPDWGTSERRHDMNHFMARLIFCFFAEDTDIFTEELFTRTVEQMSARDSSNTHEVISTLFRAMDMKREERANAGIPRWADGFPYVNGGLFAGDPGVPRFTRAARSYLLHVGSLDWTQINPDIFGSMIQAVADEDERGALGMHYTSRPNILKVLNPLFLDDLREKLSDAGDNTRKLLNLRSRMARIRVFDPACGSGNFLVIAYKELREIEAEINRRRGELNRKSEIPPTNFRGIEIRDFAAEIARLSLIVAEFQCDVLYRGKQLALAEFLPLQKENWIVQGNALSLDWLSVCPPMGTGVKLYAEDLFSTPLAQAEIDFKNEGGETYICGNPPYKGSNWRTKEQTAELGAIFSPYANNWRALDYVAAWFLKAADYSRRSKNTYSAFVATNSICQGLQASILWPIVFQFGQGIRFAHTSFKWANLASHNAGVAVVVVGLAPEPIGQRKLFETDFDGITIVREVPRINAYLLNARDVFVEAAKDPLAFDARITDGSGALDGGHLILDKNEKNRIEQMEGGRFSSLVRPYAGSGEFIKGTLRWCLWIDDGQLSLAEQSSEISARIDAVREFRKNAGTRAKTAVLRPHRFAWVNKQSGNQVIVPTVFSEKRDYITAGYLNEQWIISNAASIVQNAGLHVLSIISSRLHLVWAQAVAGKLEDRIRYTSSTCYNTFPIPMLTEKNRADLEQCSKGILLAREMHFPATIADLYDPDTMPGDLRAAHDRNDEVLERIYIGRRFKNDTERLEKLFDLYTKMTSAEKPRNAKGNA